MDSVDILDVSASILGGAFYINSNSDILLELTNTNIDTCYVGSGTASSTSVKGGMAYLNTNNDATVTITSCPSIKGIYSTGYGGLIEVDISTKHFYMTITDTIFYNIYSLLSGSLIKIEGDNSMYTELTIATSTFECRTNGLWENYLTNVYSKLFTSTYDIGALIYLENGVTGKVDSTSNTFKRCYTADTGGIFYMPKLTVLTDY